MRLNKSIITIVLSYILLPFYARAESLVYPPYFHSYGIRKATPVKLFMFFGNKTAFDDPQGIVAVKMKTRDDPATEKDDDELTVYGVNSGRDQIIYNTSMWGLTIYGSRGSGVGQFLNPKGIAADPEGNVYIADCGNNRVVRLFNPRKEVRWVGAFTDNKDGGPMFSSPTQLSLDARGRIYVGDYGHERIVVLSASGDVCRIIPEHGEWAFDGGVTALAVADGAEAWSNFPLEHSIFCADRNGKRLWKIDFNGNPVKYIDMPQGHRAGYAATDYYHSVWITDREGHCVLKFDKDLRLLDIFGSFGTGKNQFVEPRGISIWKRYGQTFITEKNGAQYFWIGTDLKSSNLSVLQGRRCELTVNVTEYSYISLFLKPRRDTTWIFRRRMAGPGEDVIRFNDDNNRIEPQSRLLLKIEPTYSSYMYFSLDFPIQIK
jgi:DNA-binding beta-propeller fold protein YncE